MKVWRSGQGSQAASPHDLRILDDVEEGLRKAGDRHSHVVSVGISAHYFDTYDFEVVVELAPGTNVMVRYGSVDEEDYAGDPEDRDGGAVAHLVLSTVAELRLMGVELLADILHELRKRTRQFLAEWSAAGTHVDLRDIRLIRHEHRPNVGDLPIEFALHRLDRRLRPVVEWNEVNHPDLIGIALVKLRPAMDLRYLMHRALSRQGADGLIDQLAVNAIAAHMDVGAALRQIGAGKWPGIPGSLTIFDEKFRVRCHGKDSRHTGVEWDRDTVTILGKVLPATVLTAKFGRPVTELVTHAVLSDNMTILDTSSHSDEFGHSITVTFDQPRLAFCGVSGRVWQLDPALGGMPRMDEADDATV